MSIDRQINVRMLINHDPAVTLNILGTGAIAEEIAGWVEHTGIHNIRLLDHDAFLDIQSGDQCLLAFGSLEHHDRRAQWIRHFDTLEVRWCSFIHPSVVVHPLATVGDGCVICPQSVIGSRVTLGKFVYIGDGGLIGHNASVGNNVFFGPGCVVGGNTEIRDDVYVGMKSMIRDKIIISAQTGFCMSSVVTTDIVTPGIYYGNRKKHPSTIRD